MFDFEAFVEWMESQGFTELFFPPEPPPDPNRRYYA